MIKAKIERILTETFAPGFLEVVDKSHEHAGHAGASQGGLSFAKASEKSHQSLGEGGHYQVTIAAKSFEGKKLLQSHRMIYRALEPVKSSIHALAIKVVELGP